MPLPLVALVPYWRDNQLVREAVDTARSLDRVIVCDGRFADVDGPDLSEPVQDWFPRQRNLRRIPGRVFKSEAEKRTALLAAAQLEYERGWALWLDSDELLRNALALPRLLSDLPERVLCFPLPFLDDDGQVVLATWKLVRFSPQTTWAGRGYFMQEGSTVYDLCGKDGPQKLDYHAWPLLSGCCYLAHRPQARPAERVRLGTRRETREGHPAEFVSELPL